MRERRKVGTVVASLMMRIPIEKNALSVVETRKKIRSFEKQARRLRGSIWYHETQRGLADFLAAQVDPHPHKDTGTVSALATLAGSLDDVIANCDLAAARLAGPEEQVEDGFVFTVLAIALRRIAVNCSGVKPPGCRVAQVATWIVPSVKRSGNPA